MADSEVRQKFEAWYLKTPLIDERPKSEIQWESWRAAYESGEIAMKEKAAKTVEHFADELTPKEWPKHGLCPTAGRFDGGWSELVVPVLAKWIRALPLSGAEESKKEKA